MNWKDIPASERSKLLSAKLEGVPVEELASKIGIRPGTLDRRLRELAASVREPDTKTRRPAKKRKDWSQHPQFYGSAMITGDFHMPYVDYEFAERMLESARILLPRPRRLIIAGDLFNMDAFSPFPPSHTYRSTWKDEIASARHLLEDMTEVFDEIHILLGNHERRLLYRVTGELDATDLRVLLGVGGVEMYDESFCVVESTGVEWRVTHQKNYSINAQTVGMKLAHKYRQNIITHHQHKVSKGYDTSGECVIIDNGCMADPVLLDYVNAVDNTSPVMKQSFTIVNDGAATVFGNDEKFTDWNLILG